MRSRAVKFFLVTALLVASITLAIPATASADALAWTQAPCVAYANGGANFYAGSGTEVITPNGDVALSCHLTLVYGTPVAEPTSTTYGNCALLQLPSGKAELSCHYAL
jgi:hypothetical protein